MDPAVLESVVNSGVDSEDLIDSLVLEASVNSGQIDEIVDPVDVAEYAELEPEQTDGIAENDATPTITKV
jgi:hypothetical protein